MKIKSLFKRASIVAVAAGLISVYALSMPTSAIPYDPSTTGTTYPAFNVFTGVPVEGDESDFLRGKEETDPGASVTNVQSACNDGTRYTLRAYVHNSANQTLNNNGSGPGVARNTKVKIALPSQSTASNFPINGTISADNATTVSDGMTINCANGKVVKLSYVTGSAKQFTGFTGTQPLSDSIVSTGALIGTHQPDGNVWGCFGQRVWVTLTVVVNVVPPNPQPPVYTCDLLNIEASLNRSVKISTFNTTANNGATFKDAVVDWGDGTKTTDANIVGKTHTYAKDGTYTITSTARFTVNGQEVTATSQNCAKQVTFQGGKPPVVTPPTNVPGAGGPTTLVNTGPGQVAALFGATTAAGATAYRWMLGRRLS